MALQKTIELPNGLIAENAYHKMTLVQVSSHGATTSAVVRMTTYKDQDAANNVDAPAILNREYNFTFDKSDTSAAAYMKMYTELAAHPDFEGAVSV